MKKILVVCLGNICRSPMAEGILRQVSIQHGLELKIDSAGTGNYHIGESPDPRAIHAMNKFGIDISGLQARQLVSSDFDEFDQIFVMDHSNLRDALKLARDKTHQNKISLIMEMVNPGEQIEVPDPWFGGQEGFVQVYNMLNEAAHQIIMHLKPGNIASEKNN